MHIDSLTRMAQDYLRTIFKVQEWRPAPVSVNELAERMGVATSTASGNVRKLVADGFIEHQPYGGVNLTPPGRRAALQMARRHRLLEAFLVERLGYSWDEVHEEAEDLEHAASDLFIERIEADLGYPTHDPHGDAIPDRDGVMVQTSARPLADVSPGSCGRVTRISDDDPEVLRYLTGHDIAIGSHLRVHHRNDGAGVLTIARSAEAAAPIAGADAPGDTAGDGATSPIDLGLSAAATIWLTADEHPESIIATD